MALTVNELPARTYRWLHLNSEELQADDVHYSRYSIANPEMIPESVIVEENVEPAVAESIFAESHKACLKADEGQPIPNGDTAADNAGQIVRTGMGIAVDDLLDSHGVKATVIKTVTGSKVAEPVVIHEVLGKEENALSRQVLIVPDGAEMTVIVDYSSEEGADGIDGISTKFFVGRDAILHLVKVQMFGHDVTHFDDIGGVCLDGGAFDFTRMEIGSGRAYIGTCVSLLGRGSRSDNSTGYIVRDDGFLDMNYIAEQRGRKTESTAVYRGILKDNARKNWRGTLDFRVGACGSVGDEQEDTLLLSSGVENRSIPLILCGEEDVDGRHGASIGQLSEDMLFYMEARGMDEETAKKIMVRARLDSVARLIPDGNLRNKVSMYLDSIL